MIGKKRKPGQPKKTTSALRKQDDYISSDASQSDTDTVDSEPAPVKKSKKKEVLPKKTPKKRGPKPKAKTAAKTKQAAKKK